MVITFKFIYRLGTHKGRTSFELIPISVKSVKDDKKVKNLVWSDDTSADYAKQWYDAIKVLCLAYEDDSLVFNSVIYFRRKLKNQTLRVELLWFREDNLILRLELLCLNLLP